MAATAVRLGTGSAALLAATVWLAAPASADATREHHEAHALRAGGSVSLDNVNGDVTIEAWDKDEVSIDAHIAAHDEDDLDTVRVEVRSSANRVDIDTRYDSHGWSCQRGVRVDYVVKVPRGAHLRSVELVNGQLDVRGVAGDVKASLVNGDLTARGLAGQAELETVNGQLVADIGTLADGQRLQLSSVNGGIELTLPSDADAELRGETVHGRIRSDVGRVEKHRWIGSSLDGRVGGGSARIDMETVNGSIEVRQAR